MRRTLAVVVPLAILAGCSHPGTSLGATRAGPPPIEATTQLLGPNGELRGTATLSQRPEGTVVRARIEGLIAGTYAIHLHSVGKCEGPKFTSAGGHFNPTMKMHGSRNPAGPHAGDLTNINIPEGGALRVELLAPNVRLGPGDGTLFDADGAAIVIHALADDYQTDPSGASGTRIACGVIKR